MSEWDDRDQQEEKGPNEEALMKEGLTGEDALEEDELFLGDEDPEFQDEANAEEEEE